MLKQCSLLMSRIDQYNDSLLILVESVITTWQQFTLLAEGKNLSDGLQALLKETGETPWLLHLNQNPLDEESVKILREAVPHDRLFKELRELLNPKSQRSGKYERLDAAPYREQPHKANDSYHVQTLHHQEPERRSGGNLLQYAALLGSLAAVIAAVVILIVVLRQSFAGVLEVIQQAEYYSISREAALDLLKMLGILLSGILLGGAIFGRKSKK